MFTGLLGHTCTIQKTASSDDRFGQPSKTWDEDNEFSGVACRLRAATGREITTFEVRDKLEVSHILYVDSDVLIVEGDRVSKVLDPGDVSILELADVVLVKRISAMIGTGHHLEVALRVLRDDG